MWTSCRFERVVVARLLLAKELQLVVFAMSGVEARDTDGHGAIDINRNVRNALLVFEFAQVVHQELRAIDCKCRNHQRAAAFHRLIHDVRQRVRNRAAGMIAVAVRGFAKEEIGAGGRFRVVEDGRAVAAQVAGEQDEGLFAIFGDGQLEPGSAENVSGVVRTHRKLRAEGERVCARHFAKLLKRLPRFFDGVERERRIVAGVFFLSGEARLFFLQVRGVRQKQKAELVRGGVGINGAAVTVADEPGQEAGVIDVRVSENDPVDGGRIDGEFVPVALFELVRALEEAAVDEQAFAASLDEIFRSGNRARRAQKRDFRHRADILERTPRNAVLFPRSCRQGLFLLYTPREAARLGWMRRRQGWVPKRREAFP